MNQILNAHTHTHTHTHPHTQVHWYKNGYQDEEEEEVEGKEKMMNLVKALWLYEVETWEFCLYDPIESIFFLMLLYYPIVQRCLWFNQRWFVGMIEKCICSVMNCTILPICNEPECIRNYFWLPFIYINENISLFQNAVVHPKQTNKKMNTNDASRTTIHPHKHTHI